MKFFFYVEGGGEKERGHLLVYEFLSKQQIQSIYIPTIPQGLKIYSNVKRKMFVITKVVCKLQVMSFNY